MIEDQQVQDEQPAEQERQVVVLDATGPVIQLNDVAEAVSPTVHLPSVRHSQHADDEP